jgi:hypothetical protein
MPRRRAAPELAVLDDLGVACPHGRQCVGDGGSYDEPEQKSEHRRPTEFLPLHVHGPTGKHAMCQPRIAKQAAFGACASVPVARR